MPFHPTLQLCAKHVLIFCNYIWQRDLSYCCVDGILYCIKNIVDPIHIKIFLGNLNFHSPVLTVQILHQVQEGLHRPSRRNY